MTTQATGTTFDPMVIPDSPDAIMAHALKLGEMMDDGVIQPSDTPDADAKAAADAAAAKAAEDAAKAADDAAKAEADKKAVATPSDTKVEAEGVLTKDGKHVIPYAVLSAAREREEAARQQAADANRRAEEAERALAEAKAGKVQEEALSPFQAKIDEVKAQLEGLVDLESKDVPEIHRPMKVMLEAQLFNLEHQMAIEKDRLAEQAQRTQRNQQEQSEALRTEQEKADEAVDANPVLRYWRDKAPAMYDIAAETDAKFREDPAMRALSYSDRFAKVVEHIEGQYGKAALPPEYAPKTPASSDATKPGANAQPGAAPAARSLTLSDLPGGAPPIQSDAKLDSLSNHEIGNHVNRLMDRGVTDPLALIRALELPVSV